MTVRVLYQYQLVAWGRSGGALIRYALPHGRASLAAPNKWLAKRTSEMAVLLDVDGHNVGGLPVDGKDDIYLSASAQALRQLDIYLVQPFIARL